MSTLYTFDVEGRYLLIRGEDNTVQARWSRAGVAVVPTAGTIRVRRQSGDVVTGPSAFTVSSDGTASFVIPAASTQDLALEPGWIIEWLDVGFPDGSTRSFVADGALCRYVLPPMVSVQDLSRRISRLSATHRSPMVSVMDLQVKVEEAHQEIEHRLWQQGRRPELVMSPTQFRRPSLLLCLSLVLADLALDSASDAFRLEAERYRQEFLEVWRQLVFTYDADEDGLPDNGGLPTGNTYGTVWLSSRGNYRDWGDDV